MSTPSAIINITSAFQPVFGVEEYDIAASVADGSGFFYGTSFAVGDYIFDDGAFGIFRWKILSISAQNFSSISMIVKYDQLDPHPAPDSGPSGFGVITRAFAEGEFPLIAIPSVSINGALGMSESLYTALVNNNDRSGAFANENSGASAKKMVSGGVFALGSPVAKLPNGKIVLADTDAVGGEQNFIGIAAAAATGVDEIIKVLIPGQNIAGALTGLGFTSGDEIFLGESGGYTNDVSTFSDFNDSYIRIGVADCAAGVASATAVDLIMFTEVIARPS